MYTLLARKLHTLCYAQGKVSHHGKERLHGYVELCTNKKEIILQPRYRLSFTSRTAASFHLIEGSPPKRKTDDTRPTERSTVGTVTMESTTLVGNFASIHF